MKTYNGDRSWNAWNVSLWINNDEGLYFAAVDIINDIKKKKPNWTAGRVASRAADRYIAEVVGFDAKTPDGAKYNKLAIKLAIVDILED